MLVLQVVAGLVGGVTGFFFICVILGFQAMPPWFRDSDAEELRHPLTREERITKRVCLPLMDCVDFLTLCEGLGSLIQWTLTGAGLAVWLVRALFVGS
ncbi:Hypothetical protein POVN_LOCUS298 [uncultured virus]|nr:Hypothetical protein POVN_LOCUS298 [uncultured virus]